MQGRMRGNEFRTTVVCVDGYEHGVLSGRMYNPYLPGGETFQSLVEFLQQMETMLDGMQFPQAFAAKRSFRDPPIQSAAGPPDPGPQEGERATFAVRVIFRQNATWQGSVAWLEGGREESFRSALELILLMDSALGGAGQSKNLKNQKRVPSSPSCKSMTESQL